MLPVEQRMRDRRPDIAGLRDAMGWGESETLDRIFYEGNSFLHGVPFKSGSDLRRTPVEVLRANGCDNVDEYIAMVFDIGLDRLRSINGLHPVRTSVEVVE